MDIYYACKYTPIELIEACGHTAVPLSFETASFETAEAKTSPNICGYAKSLIEFALSGKVQALVLTTCCDAMRRAYDVLKREAEKGDCSLEFVYLLDLPHDGSEEAARRYAKELQRFQDSLESCPKNEMDRKKLLLAWEKSAEGSIKDSDRTSSVLLLGAHATPSLLNMGADVFGSAFENLTCSGERLLPAPPRDLLRDPSESPCEHACDLEGASERQSECAPDLERDPSAKRNGQVSGSLSASSGKQSEGVSEHEKADCGPRPLLLSYAEALLNQTPCYRMINIEQRKPFLRKRIAETSAAGCIFHTMKFCDFYGFEHAQSAKNLKLPLLKIETEGTPQSTGQIKTRLEAFAESIGTSAGASAKEKPMVFSATNETKPQDTRGAEAPSAPLYVMGIDSGSTSTDAVIVDNAGTIVASAIVPTGANALKSAQAAYDAVLNKAQLTPTDIRFCVGTGYGRDALPHTNCTITEITCHAKGAHALVPQTRTIIDIGGQDSKVIQIDEQGHVETFAMNDKCAAGTGRFIEALARTMELELNEFAKAALAWKPGVSQDVVISSMCTVFAESEVISLVADNVDTVDIIHGLNKSVAQKTASLTKRVKATGPYLMTGGVAQNVGVIRALEEVLGEPVATTKEAQIAGAYGAALLGLERIAQLD